MTNSPLYIYVWHTWINHICLADSHIFHVLTNVFIDTYNVGVCININTYIYAYLNQFLVPSTWGIHKISNQNSDTCRCDCRKVDNKKCRYSLGDFRRSTTSSPPLLRAREMIFVADPISCGRKWKPRLVLFHSIAHVLLYMYADMYTCMCVCVYLYIYIHMYLYFYLFVFTYFLSFTYLSRKSESDRHGGLHEVVKPCEKWPLVPKTVPHCTCTCSKQRERYHTEWETTR